MSASPPPSNGWVDVRTGARVDLCPAGQAHPPERCLHPRPGPRGVLEFGPCPWCGSRACATLDMHLRLAAAPTISRGATHEQ